MKFFNWQVGISVVKRLDPPKIEKEIKSLVILFICRQHLILEANLLSPLIYIKIVVLFIIIRIVKVRCRR